MLSIWLCLPLYVSAMPIKPCTSSIMCYLVPGKLLYFLFLFLKVIYHHVCNKKKNQTMTHQKIKSKPSFRFLKVSLAITRVLGLA